MKIYKLAFIVELVLDVLSLFFDQFFKVLGHQFFGLLGHLSWLYLGLLAHVFLLLQSLFEFFVLFKELFL